MRLLFLAIGGWLCFGVVNNDVFAQDYRPGYIIKSNLDSVNGYIRYSTERKNSSYSKFRPSRKEKSRTFSPDDLKGYGFHGDKRYKSIYLPDDTSHRKVFAKELAIGPLGLYQHRETFLVKKDSFILLPVPKKEFVDSDRGKMLKQDLRYKGLLNQLVADCSLSAENTNYSEKDLVELVTNYNRCRGFEAPAREGKPMFKVNYSVFAGYSKSKFNVWDYPETFEPSSTITGGLGFDISSPRIFDRIFFTISASYLKNIFQTNRTTSEGDDLIHREAKMNFTSIKVPFGLRYNFLSSRNTPYIKIGFTTSVLLDHNIKISEVVETPDGTMFVTQYSDGGFDIKKSPKGFWAGLGYNRKLFNVQFYVEAWSEYGSGFMGTTTHRYSDMSSITLLSGIRF